MIGSVIALFIGGIIGGMLTGIIGIGGGILYLFFLALAFENIGVDPDLMPEFMIANSMCCVFFASLSAGFQLYKMKQMYWKETLFTLGSSALFSFLTQEFIVHTNWFSMFYFRIILLFMLLYILKTYIFDIKNKKEDTEKPEINSPLGLAIAGTFGGTIAALSGLGGGIVMIPILNRFLFIPIKKVRSISISVILFTSMFLTIANLQKTVPIDISYDHIGYIVWPICSIIVVGVLIGGALGVKISEQLNPRSIIKIYVGFLLVFAIKLTYELFLK